MTRRHVEVLAAGVLTTLQDRGRTGLAHLGVPRAGPLDAPAAALANRVVGKQPEAAVLEVTMGGLELRTSTGVWVAVTGAAGAVLVDGSARGHGRAEWLPSGARLVVGPPKAGVRSYVAFAGGLAVEPVLGSRSTDTLAGVGPPVLRPGDRLPLGAAYGAPRFADVPRPPRGGPLRITPGPRADWVAPESWEALLTTTWRVTADSNRVGLRLDGPPLRRTRRGELPSEGMVLGAVQVPPSGLPVVFLADHPVTGGYPVVGVVRREDLWQCAQLRPGDPMRFARDA